MPSPQHKLLTKTAEEPARMLGQVVLASQRVAAPAHAVARKTKDYWHMLGPGLTTGASDDDPSGIATYSQVGAQFGYRFLWLSPWTLPLSAVVQEMCARIGLVTGRGLAGNIRIHYSKRVLYACTALLFAANAFNIGADLGAMAKAVQLINGRIPFALLVIAFALFSMTLQIFTPYVRYAKYLKWLALVLLSYILSAVLAHLNWREVFSHSLMPSLHFTKNEILLVCAVLGTTISPYLFFWQTSQEVEEQVLMGRTTLKERRPTDPADIKSMRIDVWSGMFLSQVVMFFIIAACGGILFKHGITEITSAAQAAEALRPFAGNATYFLFAIGIIGTGLLSIPVLAGSSSYALAESLRWREGLYRRLDKAYAFYGIIILSMLVGLGMNFLGIDPIKALIYAAVANGLVAPIILFLIVRMSGQKKIMGHWKNKPLTRIVGWLTVALMTASGIGALITLF
ncbi:MAG TPA: divalent metal cation transporter [Candidatus Saccharimonadales bacterium]|jgi:NRAMP (natural resistance-associated macrophage protein)-like metal ion transporter|nr:divalent metal cation transporter [Candidatus Saccharimonadales bacterium]